MKTLPEKPATSIVLFETRRAAVSAGQLIMSDLKQPHRRL
jgi:hypothetical protein